MFTWLRDRLGLYSLSAKIEVWRDDITIRQIEIMNTQSRIEKAIAVHNMAVARLIAKLDPMYGKSELDSDRKAASDKIGAEVMQRIIGDFQAMKHLEGK